MKKRVYTIDGKRLVVGDANSVTKDELLLEKESGGYVLKDYEGDTVTAGAAAPEFLQQALYYAHNSDCTALFPFENEFLPVNNISEARVYASDIAQVYSYVTHSTTKYAFSRAINIGNYYGDYGSYGFRFNMPSIYNSYLLSKYKGLASARLPYSSGDYEKLIREAYVNKYKDPTIASRFTYLNRSPLFISFVMSLPDKYITSTKSPLTEEDLMSTVRKAMQDYKVVCSFTENDSPIFGVLYTYENDLTVNSDSHGLYFTNVSADSSAKSGAIGFPNLDTLNKETITDHTSTIITDLDTICKLIYLIPDGKFSVSGEKEVVNSGQNHTVQYVYIYMIYDGAADKFYPIRHGN